MNKKIALIAILLSTFLILSALAIQSVQSNSTFRITRFIVISVGSGYTTPHVVISGGGGSGATAMARVSQGSIISVILLSYGSGYSSIPTVTLRDPSPRAKGAVVLAVTDELGILVNPPSFNNITLERNSTTVLPTFLYATITNIGNVEEAIFLSTTGLPPHISLTWNCTGIVLLPSQMVVAELKLTSPIDAPLEPFSSNMIITGVET